MLKLNRNIKVQVGSKSRRRISVIDNGSDFAYTFDENGLHHLGEQYQLPPTPLNVRRTQSGYNFYETNNPDFIALGAVGFSYWLAPIANKDNGYFEFARLDKGDLLTIFRRDGANSVSQTATADLLGGVHPFISRTAANDFFYGNAQLFKLTNTQYYMAGAQHLDIGETIPNAGIISDNFSQSRTRGPIAVYNILTLTDTGTLTAAKITQSGTFTNLDTQNFTRSVVCPTSITHLATFGGEDYFLQSNATNPGLNLNREGVLQAGNVGPVIALLEINSLGQYGGTRSVAYGQSYRIVRLATPTSTLREVAFSRNDQPGTSPFHRELGQSLPAASLGIDEGSVIYDTNLIGNLATVQTTPPQSITGFGDLSGLECYAMLRIDDRYVLHKTTFPTASTATTLSINKAPMTVPIAVLPNNTFDAFYCNTMLGTAGIGIDCHLYVNGVNQVQGAVSATSGEVSGLTSGIVNLPGTNIYNGYLRGVRIKDITLPMSFMIENVIYDILTIDTMASATAQITFAERRL